MVLMVPPLPLATVHLAPAPRRRRRPWTLSKIFRKRL
jgi:hypothetical protein